jgi:hypothetical protein
MKFNSIIVVAAVAFRVAQADFMVYTIPPVPTDSIPKFTDAAEVSLRSRQSIISHLTLLKHQAGL